MIKIGKENDNNYIVDDPHVSRHHAQLEKQEDGVWLLIDLNSTNGTFVNDQQVARKRVNTKDEIRFGGHICSLSDILNQHNDYSEEFALLKGIYDRYIESKVKIQSSNQFKTRLLQSIPFALLGVVGVTLSFLEKGSPLLMVISFIVMVCAPTIGIFLGAKQSAKVPRQLQHIANQFKIDYVCPKCGTFLGEIPWESLRNRKQCPVSSCKAKWINE